MTPGLPAQPRLVRHRLRRRLLRLVVILVGLVVIVGAVAVTAAVMSRQATVVAHRMHVDSRRAALLSVTVREQYIHEAHTIILRDHSHLDHHDAWLKTLAQELETLRPEVVPGSLPRLDRVATASRDLRDVFKQEVVPAIDTGDLTRVRVTHHHANELVDAMTAEADALSREFEDRANAAEAEADAIMRTSVALCVVVAGAAMVIALLAGRGIWRAFSEPLATLDEVARRVTAGDRRARLPDFPAEELRPVGAAFNQMLDELERTQTELVATERLAAIGRVAAGVAHELNNPIAVIRGYVKTMIEDTSSQQLREELVIIDDEATACQRIAEDLLAYTHAPSLALQTVDAEALLREACERTLAARPVGETREIEQTIESARLRVDPLRIRQVVVNLLSNALHASAAKSAVRLVGRACGDDYSLAVIDQGTGIAESARPHVFEPFFSTRRDGNGLGLAVCQGLVAAHGGTIRAEAAAAGGTAFTVDLPGVVVTTEGRSA